MTDSDFQSAVQLGKSRSDCAPQYIDDLVSLVQHSTNIPGCIVECGSYKCGMSIAMAAAAEHCKSYKRVYACDTFGGLPYGKDQADFLGFADTSFEEIAAVTAPFNITLVRGRHEDTIPRFPKQDIALIFLDSDFYSSHRVVLKHLWSMLSPNGSIIFHDWTFPGVQDAVGEFFTAERQRECDYFGTTGDPALMGWIHKKA